MFVCLFIFLCVCVNLFVCNIYVHPVYSEQGAVIKFVQNITANINSGNSKIMQLKLFLNMISTLKGKLIQFNSKIKLEQNCWFYLIQMYQIFFSSVKQIRVIFLFLIFKSIFRGNAYRLKMFRLWKSADYFNDK